MIATWVEEFAPPATQPRDWHGRWLAKGGALGAPQPGAGPAPLEDEEAYTLLANASPFANPEHPVEGLEHPLGIEPAAKIDISDDEFEATQDYQANGYHNINAALRSGIRPGTTEVHKGELKDIAAIDGLLDHESTPADVIVYRGLGHNIGAATFDPDHADETAPKLIGQESVEKGYLSTTFTKDMALDFADATPESEGEWSYNIMRLAVPKGTHGVVMPGEEHEFLMARGQRMKIDGVHVQPGFGNFPGYVRIFDAHLVPSEPPGPVVATIAEFAPPATQPRDWHGRWLAKGSPGGLAIPSPLRTATETAADIAALPEVAEETGSGLDDPVAVIERNRQQIIAEHGESGQAVVDFVNDWTGDITGNQIPEIRAKAAAGDPHVRAAVDVIKAAPPTEEVLHRGMTFQGDRSRWDSVQPGDELPVQVASSFTDDPTIAQGIAHNDGIILTLRPGSRALHVQPISDTPYEHEWLTAQPLRVVSVTNHTSPEENWQGWGPQAHLLEIEVETA